MTGSFFKDLASKLFDVVTLGLACVCLGNELAELLNMILLDNHNYGLSTLVGVGCASFGLYHLKNNVWSASAPAKSSESAESEDR